MKGDRAAVQSLMQQKADVNAAQADGATAIQWAAYRDDLEMADVLIAAGANIKLANREGATPLYLASLHGSAPMIEKLLKAGADPNQLGPEGETPLMLAARTGNLDAIRVLLDHHADVNAKDKLRGTTALMWATEQAPSGGGETADRARRNGGRADRDRYAKRAQQSGEHGEAALAFELRRSWQTRPWKRRHSCASRGAAASQVPRPLQPQRRRAGRQ